MRLFILTRYLLKQLAVTKTAKEPMSKAWTYMKSTCVPHKSTPRCVASNTRAYFWLRAPQVIRTKINWQKRKGKSPQGPPPTSPPPRVECHTLISLVHGHVAARHNTQRRFPSFEPPAIAFVYSRANPGPTLRKRLTRPANKLQSTFAIGCKTKKILFSVAHYFKKNESVRVSEIQWKFTEF